MTRSAHRWGAQVVKSVFSEWYEPDDDEIASFIKTGTIALDTNVLNSLYRVNTAQRKQVLEVLTEVADRLWIPYQVGLEYQRGRLDRIADQGKAYEAVRTAVNGVKKSAETAIRDPEIRQQVTDKVDAFATDMGAFLDGLHTTHSIDDAQARHEDPVRKALDKIFVGDRIGACPADLDDRKKRANERIEAKTPPGYKDTNKPDPTGDCLIWLELLDLGSASTRPILFITDDIKEDWYRKVQGKVVGPLPALRVEWAENSDVPYHQTTLGSFLEHAKNHLETKIDEDTISSVNQKSPDFTTAFLQGFHAPPLSAESSRIIDQLLNSRELLDSIQESSETDHGSRDSRPDSTWPRADWLYKDAAIPESFTWERIRERLMAKLDFLITETDPRAAPAVNDDGSVESMKDRYARYRRYVDFQDRLYRANVGDRLIYEIAGEIGLN